jgi:hypothetical protein
MHAETWIAYRDGIVLAVSEITGALADVLRLLAGALKGA